MDVVRDELRDEKGVFCVQTIGFFDGVHIGHRYLLEQVRELALAEGMPSMVVTFRQHPASVLRPEEDVRVLSTLDEKLAKIEDCGIDYVAVLDFTPQMAQTSARDFMRDTLVRRLKGRMLVLGYDHRFGRRSAETIDDYREYAGQLGMDVRLARELLLPDGVHASSSAIRRALAAGDIVLANRLLGRPYSIAGVVGHGEGIGHRLGFPTANVVPDDPRKMLPKHAAYIVRVFVGDTLRYGMLYIGDRPTFDSLAGQRVEVHILDFDDNIYNKELRIEFVDFLRDEKAFDSPGGLKAQLGRDMEHVRAVQMKA